MLTVTPDREKLAYYGLDVATIQHTLRMAVGGETVGQIFEGDRRFDLVVRLPENIRTDLEALKRLPIRLPDTNQHEISGDADMLGVPLPPLPWWKEKPPPMSVSWRETNPLRAWRPSWEWPGVLPKHPPAQTPVRAEIVQTSGIFTRAFPHAGHR